MQFLLRLEPKLPSMDLYTMMGDEAMMLRRGCHPWPDQARDSLIFACGHHKNPQAPIDKEGGIYGPPYSPERGYHGRENASTTSTLPLTIHHPSHANTFMTRMCVVSTFELILSSSPCERCPKRAMQSLPHHQTLESLHGSFTAVPTFSLKSFMMLGRKPSLEAQLNVMDVEVKLLLQVEELGGRVLLI